MVIDPLTGVFSLSPMGRFYDHKILAFRALVLVTQHATSELLP